MPSGLCTAHSQKQSKVEYLQLLAQFDHLKIPNYYETVEIMVLCRSLPASFCEYPVQFD